MHWSFIICLTVNRLYKSHYLPQGVDWQRFNVIKSSTAVAVKLQF